MKRILALLLILLLALPSGALAFTPALLSDGDWAYFGNTPPPYDGIYRPGIYRYIGADADVTVPATLGGTTMKFISEGCFTGAGLKSVTLPDAPIYLTGEAFKGCPDLRRVVIPNAITIQENPFSNCPALSELVFDPVEPRYGVVDGMLMRLEDGLLLSAVVDADGVFTSPPETLAIAGFVLEKSEALTTVDMSDSAVKQVGLCAFSRCPSLSEVRLPEGLEVLNNGAFAGCPALTSVRLPASVTEIGKSAFMDCPGLTLTAPAGSYALTWAAENDIPCIAE